MNASARESLSVDPVIGGVTGLG
ncbi:hypothetical protein BN1263370047 [Stenotrophomonas maltophilia]|nr:hypothetical protein BN1263370047 [Stenotrophomonas maltophilia]